MTPTAIHRKSSREDLEIGEFVREGVEDRSPRSELSAVFYVLVCFISALVSIAASLQMVQR